jgi:hypothetical protein
MGRLRRAVNEPAALLCARQRLWDVQPPSLAGVRAVADALA